MDVKEVKLLGIFLLAFTYGASAGEDLKGIRGLFNKEVRAIKDAATGIEEPHNLIAVSIFGGTTYIPNRFKLITRSEEGIEFYSARSTPISEAERMTGFVTFNRVDDVSAYVSEARSHAAKLFGTPTKSSNTTKADLCVHEDIYNGADEGYELSYVYIFKENELVVINDSNPQLWKAFVYAYKESVSETSLAPSCPLFE